MPSAASFGARPGRSPLACFRQCRQPTTRIRLLSVPARNLVSARAGLHPPAVAAQQEYLTARCLSRRAWHQARLYFFQRESRCLRTQHRFDCAKCKHAKCKVKLPIWSPVPGPRGRELFPCVFLVCLSMLLLCVMFPTKIYRALLMNQRYSSEGILTETKVWLRTCIPSGNLAYAFVSGLQCY